MKQKRYAKKGYSTLFITSDDPIANFHIIEDAKEISVITFNQDTMLAKTIIVDEANDVVLPKIGTSSSPISLASTQKCLKEEEVFTLGCPLNKRFMARNKKSSFWRD